MEAKKRGAASSLTTARTTPSIKVTFVTELRELDSRGGTPFAASRRLTSPRIPTSKSSIMATLPRPPLQQYHPSVRRRERNNGGPNSALFDSDVPQVTDRGSTGVQLQTR
ncbi:hypothetical protein HZH68_005724 [Vespula germanica]|uniref:Uncharacterized protein n=2 Tax=Vespula TaxID=7451 RepID=A0A834NEU2_VESGE|nr:hypothetical protein HZH68_005724 [Vespula germanica]KAF7429882.1 hypothetical protein H0235_006280 [Vespula pensylvanica]